MIMELLVGFGCGSVSVGAAWWAVSRRPRASSSQEPVPVVWAKSPAGPRLAAAREEAQGGRRPRIRQARFSRGRYLDGGG
jgi:hypothetical protein